jgi:CheY-like chemotaxis protein
VLDVPTTLSPVAINPLILRELVIGLIAQAADSSGGSNVRIVGVEKDARVVLTVSSPTSAPIDDAELLSTSRRLAEMQGAGLSVTHEASAGALSFVLDLPVVERATILVIDDNPDVVLLFRRYLGQTYRLIQATTSDEALALAEELRPALMTLDVMMPGLDGWQILDHLRRNPRTASIPVVVCSILPEPSLAQALGAVAYLPKPINPLALRSMLDRQLDPPR